MFSKKFAFILSIFTLVILISLILFIIATTRMASAQFYGFQNTLTQGSLWSPLQNFGQYQWQNPLQTSWQAPVQNFWQSPVQNYWQPVVQNQWQPVVQNQWQNPWQAQLQYSGQIPWQIPSQTQWQYQLQNPWQIPVQNPWQPFWQQAQAQAQYQDEDVDLDADDDGSEITVEVGETIGIILEANLTTGFSWVLDTDEFDPNVVTKISNQYFPGNIYQLGSAGFEQWIFEAKALGNTTIELDYKRPWETTVQDTFLIKVSVEE